MRRRRAGLALWLAGSLGVLGAGPGAAQAPAPPRLPADFVIPRAETSPGQVTFSHARHMAKVGKCTRCHMRDLKMKRGGSGTLTMDAMQAGKTCGACHDGKRSVGGVTAFGLDQCDSCHKE